MGIWRPLTLTLGPRSWQGLPFNKLPNLGQLGKGWILVQSRQFSPPSRPPRPRNKYANCHQFVLNFPICSQCLWSLSVTGRVHITFRLVSGLASRSYRLPAAIRSGASRDPPRSGARASAPVGARSGAPFAARNPRRRPPPRTSGGLSRGQRQGVAVR